MATAVLVPPSQHPHAVTEAGEGVPLSLSGGGLDAAAWHHSALAGKILAQCAPTEFAYVPRVGILRDYQEWAPLTGSAEDIVKALALLAENAVTQELGYCWRDFDDQPDGHDKAVRWLDRHSAIPSAEEAIEIEFARRDGREPRMRWRPSADEADAFRAVVGAGL